MGYNFIGAQGPTGPTGPTGPAGSVAEAFATHSPVDNAVALNLGAARNHWIDVSDDIDTVTITGAVEGSFGSLVFHNSGPGTVTMPAPGATINYDNEIIALGADAIVEVSTDVDTWLVYEVGLGNQVYVHTRSVTGP